MSSENVIKFEEIFKLPDGETYFNRFKFIEDVMNSKSYVEYYAKKITDEQLMAVMPLLRAELLTLNKDDVRRIAKTALSADSYNVEVLFIWVIHPLKFMKFHISLTS